MYLVFDIGGTKTRIATSDDGQNLNDPIIFETPKNYQDFLSIIKDKTNSLKILAAAGGIAGPFNKDRSALIAGVNIPDFINKPLKEDLSSILGCKVFLQNDAFFTALGEAVKGSGQGFDIVGFLTISTGIGGARVTHQKVDEPSLGYEPGWQIANTDNFTTLISLASGAGLQKIHGIPAKDITDPKVWDDEAKYIAILINNTVLYWSPDIVVLGGPILNSVSLENIEKYLKGIFKVYPEYPSIKLASLEDLGGLYGALEYIKQNSN